jgi:hypothetical protein
MTKEYSNSQMTKPAFLCAFEFRASFVMMVQELVIPQSGMGLPFAAAGVFSRPGAPIAQMDRAAVS